MAPRLLRAERLARLAFCCWASAAPASKAVAAAVARAAATDVHAPVAAARSGGWQGRRLKGRKEAAAGALRLAVFPDAAGAALPEIRGGSGAALAAEGGRPAGSAAEDERAAVEVRLGAGAPQPGLSTLAAPKDPFQNPFRNPFTPFSPYAPNPFASNPYVKGPFGRNPYDNSSQEAMEPFVRVVMDWSHNETHVKVDIATPNVIASVYMLMFVPIAMAWVAMRHYGSQERHYAIILPMTLCSMIIGQDLVNQSLSALMESPTAITAIQALAMTILTGVWSVFSEMQKPTLSLASAVPLVKWFVVAILFAAYQLVNHLVSYLCSLSERTVFLNLCPVCSLALELSVLPAAARAEASFGQRMCLCAMVLGAMLFSLQYPDFTASGVLSACVLVLVLLPYRVLQRWLLVDCLELSVPVLACYDGLALLVPAWVITASNLDQFWRTWQMWFLNPSIALMLVLSWMTFTGGHVCTLLMLRASSATNYLVLHNLAGFIVVAEGIVFFGDKVVQAPLVFAGIAISLCSGVWYAVQMQKRSSTSEGEPLTSADGLKP